MFNNRHESTDNRDEDPQGGFLAPTKPANDNSEDNDGDLKEPNFRSVAVKAHYDHAIAQNNSVYGPVTTLNSLGKPLMNGRPINSSSKTSKSTVTTIEQAPEIRQAAAVVSDAELRQWKAQADEKVYVLPMYYAKCEKRSATSKEPVETLLERLHCCFKKLNIQARFEQSFATFGLVLRTVEQLELSLLIWYADKSRETIYVELDKRQCGRGCSGSSGVFPFQYICRILKCITCPCSKQDIEEDKLGLSMPKHCAMMQGHNNGHEEQLRKMELLVGAFQKKQEQGEAGSPEEMKMEYTCVEEQAVSSLQMTWRLLQSPVTWSKGLELLCDMSDADKTGISSAQVVSKVILLGTSGSSMSFSDCCGGIHEQLASMLKALSGDSRADAVEMVSNYQKDCLLQMVLTCFVNAMEVQVKFAEDISSTATVLSQFLAMTRGNSSCDVLETLINIMRHANTKPHHAYLAVKALFLLSSDVSIRNNVSVAMMVQDGSAAAPSSGGGGAAASGGCAVLQQAQEVGTQSHGLLEAECERLQRVLEMRH